FSEDPERFAFTVQLGQVDRALTAQEAIGALVQQAKQVYPDFRAEELRSAGGENRGHAGMAARWTNKRSESMAGDLIARTTDTQRGGGASTLVLFAYFYAPETNLPALVPTYSAMLQSLSLGGR